MHLLLLLLSELLVLIDDILHGHDWLTLLRVHAKIVSFGDHLLLVGRPLWVWAVGLLVICSLLLLGPLLLLLLRDLATWLWVGGLLGLAAAGSSRLILDVEVRLREHDVCLLIEHKIFVLVNTHVLLVHGVLAVWVLTLVLLLLFSRLLLLLV